MSSMEPAAMTGTIALVVAVFEQGEAVVKNIREKRAQEGAPLPPLALEQSLVEGPRAVKEAYENGWKTYGEAFKVENDRVALDAFNDILISLQGTLSQHLFPAQGNNTIDDFGVVLTASIMGRVKSVLMLNNMRMKMAEAASTKNSIGRQASQPQHTSESQLPQQISTSPENPFISPMPIFNWNDHNHTVRTDITSSTIDTFGSPLTGTTSATSHYQPNQTPGAMDNHTSRSHSSSHTTNITSDSEEADLAGSPISSKQILRKIFSPPRLGDDPFQDDPKRYPVSFPQPESVSSDGKSLYGSSSAASFGSGPPPETTSHPQMTDPPRRAITDSYGNKIPFDKSPPAERRRRLNNKPKSKRPATQDRPASFPQPALPTSKSSSPIISLLRRPKAPKQDYAGFCEGAYLMQTGKEGMKIRNQSVSMTGQNNYWTCSNSMCCFEGYALQKKDEHKRTSFGFDEDIREAHGVRYRWSFLAKSHTTIGNSKAGYEFQCVFCLGRGAPCFRVKREKEFMEHVATHQGQTPNEFKMPHFNYVVGRHASAWETFDVNLPRPTASELQSIEMPVELETTEPALPEMEAPLKSPKRVIRLMRPMRLTHGYPKETNRSGLGIRMSTGASSHDIGNQDKDGRASMHSADTGNITQAESDTDWQYDASHHHLLNGSQNGDDNDNNNDNGQKNNAPLEKNWTDVRDSIHGMHPAPLFARKPVPAPATGEREQDQHQKRKHHQQYQGHEQDQNFLPKASQVEAQNYLDTDPYNNSANDVHPALRGRISVPNPWRTSYATLSPESRQASMLVPEGPHE